MKVYHLKVYLTSLLLVTFLAQKETFSGQASIDSLRRAISNFPEGIQKADDLLSLAMMFYSEEMTDSALFYCGKSFDLSKKLDYEDGVSESYYKFSLIYKKGSDYVAAMEAAKKYLELVEPTQNDRKISKGYYNYANLLMREGKTDTAFRYFRQSLSMHIAMKDTFRILACYNAIGNAYKNLGKYDSAAYYYYNAIEICNLPDFETYLGTVYLNLGDALFKLERFEESREYLVRALELEKEHNDTRDIALCHTTLGNLALEKGDLQEAFAQYDSAMEIYQGYGDIIEKYDMYNNYAEAYEIQGRYHEALANYEKALPFYRKQGYARGMMTAWKNMADIYSVLLDFKTAKVYYDSSIVLAEQTGFRKNLLDYLWNANVNFARSGNYKTAYDYQERHYRLKDSLYNLDVNKMVVDLKFRYEREQDQARILQMELDLQRRTTQRNVYLFAGIAIVALTLFLILFFRQRAVIAQHKVRQLEEEKKLLAAKLLVEGQEEERKRIARELHDGLGVLLSATKMQFTTISEKSPENKEIIEKATKLLEQASGDVRKISHNMMPGLLTKLGLFEAVSDLFEQIGETQGITILTEIPEDVERLPENTEIMLYRIIQEMVNNTIKHAEASHIEIQLRIEDQMLNIRYTDDGKGFNVDEKLESKSIGLQSINSRVSFLNGKLIIQSSTGKGTAYTIRIPL